MEPYQAGLGSTLKRGLVKADTIGARMELYAVVEDTRGVNSMISLLAASDPVIVWESSAETPSSQDSTMHTFSSFY